MTRPPGAGFTVKPALRNASRRWSKVICLGDSRRKNMKSNYRMVVAVLRGVGVQRVRNRFRDLDERWKSASTGSGDRPLLPLFLNIVALNRARRMDLHVL